MKVLWRAIWAAVAVLWGIQSAQATDQNINITATVTSFCKIAGSTAPSDDSIDWTSLITNGDIAATATNKSYAVVCNKATNITLSSLNGAMTGPASAGAGWDNIINYTVAASGFASVSGSTASTASATGAETLGTTTRATPGSANIDLVITPVANTNPLVPGIYNDTLRVTIAPQP